MREPVPSLVSTDWLAAHLAQDEVVVLDASWYLSDMSRDAIREYHEGHIPGALFYDIDEHSAVGELPHMMPSPAQFSDSLARLGIEPDSMVVVYDGSGVNLSAPRVWWVFRSMGFERIAVLDGGLGRWRQEGRNVESGERSPETARKTFEPLLNESAVVDLAAVQRLLGTGAQIVDARSADRFLAREPEPRPGVRGGHIPGSQNLHYRALIDPATGLLLPPETLRGQFSAAGIDPTEPVIATCGSGMSACAVLLALDQLGGLLSGALYDGSWVEWGGLSETPVEAGDPA